MVEVEVCLRKRSDCSPYLWIQHQVAALTCTQTHHLPSLVGNSSRVLTFIGRCVISSALLEAINIQSAPTAGEGKVMEVEVSE